MKIEGIHKPYIDIETSSDPVGIIRELLESDHLVFIYLRNRSSLREKHPDQLRRLVLRPNTIFVNHEQFSEVLLPQHGNMYITQNHICRIRLILEPHHEHQKSFIDNLNMLRSHCFDLLRGSISIKRVASDMKKNHILRFMKAYETSLTYLSKKDIPLEHPMETQYLNILILQVESLENMQHNKKNILKNQWTINSITRGLEYLIQSSLRLMKSKPFKNEKRTPYLFAH